MRVRVGIDTGGTFTDLVAIGDNTGDISTFKLSSDNTDPARVVLAAMEGARLSPEVVEDMSFGTTVATNAAIERRGARVLFLTTVGFEDVPFIQRITRPYAYDPSWLKPSPGIRRSDCIGVRERVLATGEVLEELDDAELDRVTAEVARRLRDASDIDWAIAISLLFSYANPRHEDLLVDRLRRTFPDVPISASRSVVPLWREYERGFTTIVDASVRRLVDRLVTDVQSQLLGRGYDAPLSIMKSNGGQLDARAAGDAPIQVLLSGLAGGVIGGTYFANRVGVTDAVTFDMGGTSTDVALVRRGEHRYTNEFELEWGMPVIAPMLDFRTIGAGGGSIARIDFGGLLRVGPQSAGASPGPAAYGRGGSQATVTDANLVLGRLAPDDFVGGRMSLDRDAAEAAVTSIGESLGMTRLETAHAIVATAVDNMAGAIRLVTVEEGIDCRELALVAFGGAGPMHAVQIARTLDMPQIIIPLHPGLCSAFGAALADRRSDKRQTVYFRSDRHGVDRIASQLDALTGEVLAALRAEGFRDREPVVLRSLGMRYVGQNFEENVPVRPGSLSAEAMADAVEQFHAMYEERYGYALRTSPVEVTEISVTALGRHAPPPLRRCGPAQAVQPITQRLVSFDASGYLSTPVYERRTLGAGAVINGPAIVSEDDSTTVLPPDTQLRVSDEGVLTIGNTNPEASP